MKRKVIYLLVIFIFFSISLVAKEYQVSYVNSARTDYLAVFDYFGKKYLDINELSRIFEGDVDISSDFQKATLNILQEELTFYFDNNWVKFGEKNYNLHDNVQVIGGVYFIPEYILKLFASNFFPNKLNIENDKIYINITEINNYTIRRIVIDPGHGGRDPGAVGRSLYLAEKHLVLDIAKKAKWKLESRLGVEVFLTREGDEFTSLGDRTEFANQKQADLFVSLHCNAAWNSKSNGTEVFYLSTAQSDEARAVQALENQVIKFEDEESKSRYSDLDFILYDMRQAEHLKESADLAKMCQKRLVRKLQTKNRGVKQANFYVLRGAFMPAILVEVAFVSNKYEEKKLDSSDFRNRAAEAIYESVKSFKEKYDKSM
ncbi:MAG: N-acetylmuramoyl-L-alanine amidase [Candidatus Cloacimonetes bacterium]|nr:N-acetylmuramoyl-L-alanine amidase [Candidatus Cloacimonadota bacterium]MBS3767681.1 N-acetylmuramoyl-L-alanine amidase [Candidatus Cloacimonadota bacterium]